MGLPKKRQESKLIDNLASLSFELAQLDPADPEELYQQICLLVSTHLDTDRSSLLLLEPGSSAIGRAFSIGFDPATVVKGQSGKVVEYVCTNKKPLIVYNIQDLRQLASEWSTQYKTDAFVTFPLMTDRKPVAVLCISNLSTQQVMQFENAGLMLKTVISQLEQLLRSSTHLKAGKPAAPAPDNHLARFNALISALNRGGTAEDLIGRFCEVVSELLPATAVSFIYDQPHKGPCGTVVVGKPCPESEISRIFNDLASQWKRRHRRAPQLTFREATLLGGDLFGETDVQDLQSDMPIESETLPVVIDNELYSLIAVSAPKDVLAERSKLQLISILGHHLLLHVKKNQLSDQNQQMQTHDLLTGLYNERHFHEMMEREFERATRYNIPITILLVDVDHFKDVNETYGFETGDLLLKEISQIIMENMRNTDFCSRYSGERFVVVLPETPYANSDVMANRLRRFIENHSFYVPDTNVFLKVTVSVGVASYIEHKPATLSQFIEFADTALYFAKRNGRNQVVGYGYVLDLMIGDSDNES